MAGIAANSECRDVGSACAFGDQLVNVECDNSDTAVQTLSTRLWREWRLCACDLNRSISDTYRLDIG
jgi:hypothetical protein